MPKQLIIVGILFSLLLGSCATPYPSYYGTSSVDTQKRDNYIIAGSKFFEQKQFAEALEQFNKALEIAPNYWMTVQWQAVTLVELGKYDEGIQALNNALKVGPTTSYHVSNNWLGIANLRKKDYAQAINYFKQAVLYKGSALDYFLLAHSYDLNNNVDEAINNFSKAITNNDYADMERHYTTYARAICYEHRGFGYFKKGQNEQAKADAKKVFELFPRYLKVFDNAQNILTFFDFAKRKAVSEEAMKAAKQAESSGNYQEAFNQLEKVQSWAPIYDPVTLNSTDQETFNGFLSVYPKLTLKPALPETGRRFFVQAETYSKDKNYNLAMKAYSDLLDYVPWFAEGWYNAALIRAEQKNYERAINNMKNYLKLAPDAPDARAAQDKIYEWEALMKQQVTITI